MIEYALLGYQYNQMIISGYPKMNSKWVEFCSKNINLEKISNTEILIVLGIYHDKFEEVLNFSKKLDRLVVITRGEKGAVAINGDKIFESDIQKKVKIVDLTGAGDLFAAGFLHGYINKLSTKECLEKGTEMSSKVIQQIGARL